MEFHADTADTRRADARRETFGGGCGLRSVGQRAMAGGELEQIQFLCLESN
jgi:hypothetical protein